MMGVKSHISIILISTIIILIQIYASFIAYEYQRWAMLFFHILTIGFFALILSKGWVKMWELIDEKSTS